METEKRRKHRHDERRHKRSRRSRSRSRSPLERPESASQELARLRAACEQLRALLRAYPGERKALRELLWSVDAGQGVAVAALADQGLKSALESLCVAPSSAPPSRALTRLSPASPPVGSTSLLRACTLRAQAPLLSCAA